jgi:hypothetical protein
LPFSSKEECIEFRDGNYGDCGFDWENWLHLTCFFFVIVVIFSYL